MKEINDDDTQKLIELLQSVFKSPKLSETQQEQLELVALIHDAMKPSETLRRIADLTDRTAEQSPAEVLAGGVLHHLDEAEVLAELPQLQRMFAKMIIAHWMIMYGRYLTEKEV